MTLSKNCAGGLWGDEQAGRVLVKDHNLSHPSHVKRARGRLARNFGARSPVRMANLACVGSHAINGVAELHSELLTREVLRVSTSCDRRSSGTRPDKRVTLRSWMVLSNSPLTARLKSMRTLFHRRVADVSRVEQDHPARVPAGDQIFKCLRRLAHGIGTGDQLVELESAHAVHVDQLGEIFARAA
jgi:hypothetical protein